MKNSLLLLLLVLFVGCVGTVQESSVPSGVNYTSEPKRFSYSGIVAARAIAHDKIEIEFFAAPGASDNFRYFLTINDSETPVEISLTSTTAGISGRRIYVLRNLDMARQYKLKLSARNAVENSTSSGEVEMFVTTFDNRVANFDGVSRLSLLPGQTDRSIMVEWVPTAMQGIFAAGIFDPVHYEVTAISNGGAVNINNSTYTGSDRRQVLVPQPPLRATPFGNPSSYLLENLSPDTLYYVQVRAINKLWMDYFETPSIPFIPVSREQNTRFLSIRTSPATSLFDFRQDNIQLANATGADSFDKIDVYWTAGQGSFSGYRVFVRRYDGVGSAQVDDRLSNSTLVAMNTSANVIDTGYFAVSPTLTTKRISGLDDYEWYQVKVALCKTIVCPVDTADPNAAIISDMKAIQVKPTLAAFGGINTIQSPGQYSQRDYVFSYFDAPVITSGFANVLEFYCVNPANFAEQIQFDGNNPINAPSVPSCHGLSLEGVPPTLSTYTTQSIRGTVADGLTQYCFAATPAIIGFGPEVRLAPSERVVRCIYPEIRTPTISQFPGLTGTCEVSNTDATVRWNLPAGGIYSDIHVFYREKKSSTVFSYGEAIDQTDGVSDPSSPDYTRVSLSASDVNTTISGLLPGKTYQMGVMTSVLLDTGTRLWSENNLSIKDCVIPLPVASFSGFSRIFAIGPRFDGRVPNSASLSQYPDSARMYEALDDEGLPYEVKRVVMGGAVDQATPNFVPAPGRDQGLSFSAPFDGVFNSEGLAASKAGIISLAWEDISLSFADNFFRDPQEPSYTPVVAKSARKYGYRVYRSIDNKLTWQDMTQSTGLIYTKDVTYRYRPNSGDINRKMAFFTDYSVQNATDRHDASTGTDIERARTYWYRIVPVFNGVELSYSSGQHHQVRVTLPPPNMALVHRWMANRAGCFELNRVPNITQNYTCDYNGVGAVPRSYPWTVNETALDQRGDLLVDRNELGCRYTRGDDSSTIETGASHYTTPVGAPARPPGIGDFTDNFWVKFQGYPTDSSGNIDTFRKYRGCGGINYTLSNNQSGYTDYPGSFISNWGSNLHGDCTDSSFMEVGLGVCTADQFLANTYQKVKLVTPGLRQPGAPYNCSADTTPAYRSLIPNLVQGAWSSNIILQAEFLAVFHNRHDQAGFSSPIEGPTTSSVTSSRVLDRYALNGSGRRASSCWINLAAIDGSGHLRPRWASVNNLRESVRFKGAYPDLLHKTVNEISEISTSSTEANLVLYNGDGSDTGDTAQYRLPAAFLRASNRYANTTKLGRIMVSNSAKLPPVGRIGQPELASLCALTKVEVGLQTQAGVFSALAPPQVKRPLRRRDYTTASAWSDTLTPAEIQTREASNTAGSCAGGAKTTTGSPLTLVKGDVHLNTQHYNGSSNMPLVTGSSDLADGVLSGEIHTQKCQSRYGIQDIVGNQNEHNSERIFCDYGSAQSASINFGQTTGWASGEGAINVGASGGVTFPYFNGPRADPVFILKSSTSPAPGHGVTQYTLEFSDASPAITDFKPWVFQPTGAGYCSLVNSNPDTRGTIAYRDSEGNWLDIFSPGGALNSALVSRAQADQRALYSLRNGDGFFLDFGPQGLGTKLSRSDALALFDDTPAADPTQATNNEVAKSQFFNPVIGLPLSCNANSCADPVLDNFDNKLITTSQLAANITDPDDLADVEISNFPIGNSQIYSTGVAEFEMPAGGYSTFVNSVTEINNHPFLVRSVAPTPADTNSISRVDYVVGLKDFPANTILEGWNVRWSIDRDRDLSIRSGGSAGMNKTGRYTASVGDFEAGSSDLFSGGRCAVLINED